jgi:hypothetical protein
MLKTVALHTGHQLWLPEMALEEHLAHYRSDVTIAGQQLASAAGTPRRLIHSFTLTVPALNIESATADYAERLKGVFHILPTPDQVWQQALIREARRQSPAKTSLNGAGAGARDVVIWLTALFACRERQEETYFVSQDNAAFGKDDLRPELAQELADTLGDSAGKFHYCYGIEGLLDQLATKYDPVPSEEDIEASASVREAVTAALGAPELLFQLMRAPDLMGGFGAALVRPDSIGLASGGRRMAYQIGDGTWACAESIWLVHHRFTWMFGDGSQTSAREVRITFKARTTLVMHLGDDGKIDATEVSSLSRAYEIRSDFDW